MKYLCSGNLGSIVGQSSSTNQSSLRSASSELFAQDLLRNHRFWLGLRGYDDLPTTVTLSEGGSAVVVERV